ncbi:thioredoxin domain-containing protein [Halobacteriovorax sp. YZS-1-1]|uniref:thioredoxin domain-containing protein n=1 Tax=unclassified Halobacteriovorax TaxID=2639665 RepID=UPI003999EA60
MTDIGFNRLKDEESTYLKQHKDNPVHWYAWGPEALTKAKEDNKPIFLSIGYSSCHWCHVMAEESFCDEETAKYLNEHFINIKVDREEHPDIDNYYQQACQLFTNGGGWPLSAFLMPNLRPYFVGTYFPKEAKGKSTAFKDVLKELVRAYNEEVETVTENSNKAFEAIEKGFISPEKVDFQGHFPHPNSVMDVLEQFKDNENGGFGEAPKFPQLAFYEWAIEQMLEGVVKKEHGEHIIKSIERMLMGGIYDQVRGGMHRYSTDNNWTVPHFEKMLYDQAGLLKLLAKTSMLYPSPLIFDGIFNTLEYLKAEMLNEEENFFFSAQDADSEGVEGLYFTYTQQEFEDALGRFDTEDEALTKNMEKLKEWFGVTEKGNFDSGLNVLTINNQKAQEIFTPESWDLIRNAKKALLNERKLRIPPMTDNKGIASWNFHMISALSDVMQFTQIPAIRSAASTLFNRIVEGTYKKFLETTPKGMRLRHTTTRPVGVSLLEDYVFFAEAQLRIYELSGNTVFKENLKDTLGFIIKDFLVDGRLKSRAIRDQDAELYPNQDFTSFDQSFRSPVSTLIQLVRRSSVLFGEVDMLEDIKELMENVTHDVLKNPAGSGEGLRALSYPANAYKVIKCPKTWLTNQEFAGFICYFLPRFVFDFHEDKGERWEICGTNECEMTGEGLDHFIETLKPNQPQATNE